MIKKANVATNYDDEVYCRTKHSLSQLEASVGERGQYDRVCTPTRSLIVGARKA